MVSAVAVGCRLLWWRLGVLYTILLCIRPWYSLYPIRFIHYRSSFELSNTGHCYPEIWFVDDQNSLPTWHCFEYWKWVILGIQKPIHLPVLQRSVLHKAVLISTMKTDRHQRANATVSKKVSFPVKLKQMKMWRTVTLWKMHTLAFFNPGWWSWWCWKLDKWAALLTLYIQEECTVIVTIARKL